MGNVMIVDDSPSDRKIVRKILESNLPDSAIFEAENGVEICGKLKTYNIEVCILDIIMPDKDGFQVLEEIKRNSDIMDIPVIVCTVLNDETTIEKALNLGAHDYFTKPLSKEAMKISLPLKVRNAMEFMKRKQEILYLSFHDKLTGLYNRRYFEEELNRLEAGSNLPVSIIVGDVNGLKLTNDAFGHEAGDRLLIKIADILNEECSGNDIIARTGGDEFVIILPKTTLSEAQNTIFRIKERCSREKEDPIKPNISLGCSVKEQPGQKAASVYKKAEDKMYKAKIMDGQSNRSSIISALKNSIQVHFPDVERQNRRIEELALRTGSALGLSEDQVHNLLLLIYLHNIGLSALPEDIISKKGELTPEEIQIKKKHSEIGFRIIGSIAELSHIAKDILYHHENWDGSGYPGGLKGEEIPVNARIFSIYETYDSLTYGTDGQEPKAPEEALKNILSQAGKALDPNFAEKFVKVMSSAFKTNPEFMAGRANTADSIPGCR